MGIYTNNDKNTNKGLDAFAVNKQIPNVLRKHALTALSHYPELQETTIRFIFTRQLKKSIMAARPVVRTLLQAREKRMYDILISPMFKLTQNIEPIHHLPADVLIGWLGHELGHIMDYEQRSVWGIAKFGLLYGLSKRYIRKAERAADTFAANRGMMPYILSTREFILGHSELSSTYKEKIARLYLSPDDIVDLVSDIEEKPAEQKEEVLTDEEELVENVDTFGKKDT